jgi:nucleotide-binding universal stress UspA family protein
LRSLEAYKHVLCAIDFSDSSRHAIEVAAELVTPGGAGITLFHAIELRVVYSIQLLTEWGEDLCNKVRVPISIVLETGSAGARVLDVLERNPTFDLVIVGSRGSVAETIMRHAPCPVLVARDAR